MSHRLHEQEWAVYQSGKSNHGVRRAIGEGPSMVATRIATYDEAMLLAAAPKIAAALLDILGALQRGDLNTDGAIEVATRALVAAGSVDPS